MKTLLSIGHGYSARAIAPALIENGWTVYGTVRTEESAALAEAQGVKPIIWTAPDDPSVLPLDEATHILSSVAPERGEDQMDPVLACAAMEIAHAPQLEWIGYLSTIGVYGDREGGWVDEYSERTPSTARGRARLQAEEMWTRLGQIADIPVNLFRLAGIYGPGRGPFEKVRQGKARIINKPGQVFSRIHVEDIAQVVHAAILRRDLAGAWNVCDDCPIDPGEVLAYAAELLNLPKPPVVDFDSAEMSPMARSFYSESRRVKNDRIKDELGVTLKYPDYRTGLQALLDQGLDQDAR
ncbi:SDR family oxidoreductase [Thioclava sp. GXIMD4216]|uniref:SDR family oxidoreductase n=1 Tax=Thioclava sp. GXIMD4216 TaxID=3131929 RepID=UPI0030D1DAA6